MQDRLKALGDAILINELGGDDYPRHLRVVADAENRIVELEAAIESALRHADKNGMSDWPVFVKMRKALKR